MQTVSVDLKPIIKCPGGKRQLVSEILHNFPGDFAKGYSTYVEPFVGGGAVFFEVIRQYPGKNLIINDLNEDIINLYESVKKDPTDLINRLNYFHLFNNKNNFYEVRETFNNNKGLKDISQAARFLFLNKTGYNGLIRYNKKGKFNTPFGKFKNPKIFEADQINSLNKTLKKNKVNIFNEDFSQVIWNVLENANHPEKVFFYIDPPYDTLSKTASFTQYTRQGFTRADHKRLKNHLDVITEYGAKFLLSGADTKFMRKLHPEYNIVKIKARRPINSKKNKRGKVGELLIKNYD